MSSSNTNIVKKGITGAAIGANVAGATAITSGVALTTIATPVTTFFGLIKLGVITTIVVATPVVVTWAVCGAVIGGALWAYRGHREHKAMHAEFEQYFPKTEKDNSSNAIHTRFNRL